MVRRIARRDPSAMLLPSSKTYETARRAAPEGGVVAGSLTVRVDAQPSAVRAALARVDLADVVARALRALGAGERLALEPSRLGDRTFGLIWRVDGAAARVSAADYSGFERPGHVKVRWDADVHPSGIEGSLLTLVTRFTATDGAAHGRVLDAWSVLTPLADTLVRRAARVIEAGCEPARA
jgi:hypothetical protein